MTDLSSEELARLRDDVALIIQRAKGLLFDEGPFRFVIGGQQVDEARAYVRILNAALELIEMAERCAKAELAFAELMKETIETAASEALSGKSRAHVEAEAKLAELEKRCAEAERTREHEFNRANALERYLGEAKQRTADVYQQLEASHRTIAHQDATDLDRQRQLTAAKALVQAGRDLRKAIDGDDIWFNMGGPFADAMERWDEIEERCGAALDVPPADSPGDSQAHGATRAAEELARLRTAVDALGIQFLKMQTTTSRVRWLVDRADHETVVALINAVPALIEAAQSRLEARERAQYWSDKHAAVWLQLEAAHAKVAELERQLAEIDAEIPGTGPRIDRLRSVCETFLTCQRSVAELERQLAERDATIERLTTAARADAKAELTAAAERDAAQARIAELEKRYAEAERETVRVRRLIDRDHTGLAAALNEVRDLVKAYAWLARGEWGSYDYTHHTETTLRCEIGDCLDVISRCAGNALGESGTLADKAFKEGPFILDWRDRSIAELERQLAEARAVLHARGPVMCPVCDVNQQKLTAAKALIDEILTCVDGDDWRSRRAALDAPTTEKS